MKKIPSCGQSYTNAVLQLSRGKKPVLDILPEAPSTQTWNRGEQTHTVLFLLQHPCVGHSCGTVAGFFRVKEILEEDTDCKMCYQREEPMWTTIYMRDSCCLPVCQCPTQYPSSLPWAAPSCRRSMGLEEWSCRKVVANAVCWASE